LFKNEDLSLKIKLFGTVLKDNQVAANFRFTLTVSIEIEEMHSTLFEITLINKTKILIR